MNIENAVLSSLVNDKAFVEKMLSLETPEEVHKLFQENGVDFTMEEVLELGKALDQLERCGEELDDNMLEDVNGGFAITAATAWAVAKAVIAVGGAGLAVYKWYKSR